MTRMIAAIRLGSLKESAVKESAVKFALLAGALILGALSASPAAFVATAYAQGQGECGTASDPKRMIAACTALISSNLLRDFDLAVAYSNRGAAYDDLGAYQKAINDYGAAIKINPDDPEVYVFRGLAYEKTRRLNKAMADYSRALEIDPSNVRAFSYRAWVAFKTKRYAAGLADANQAIQLAPTEATAFHARAEIYMATGRRELALSDYRTAARLAPNDGRIKAALARHSSSAAASSPAAPSPAVPSPPSAPAPVTPSPSPALPSADPPVVTPPAPRTARVAPSDIEDQADPFANQRPAPPTTPPGTPPGTPAAAPPAVQSPARPDTPNAPNASAAPSQPKESEAGRLAALYRSGVAHVDKGTFAEAVSDLTKVIDGYGKYTPAYVARAKAHEGLGDAHAAVDDYRAALKLSPGDKKIKASLRRAQKLAKSAKRRQRTATAPDARTAVEVSRKRSVDVAALPPVTDAPANPKPGASPGAADTPAVARALPEEPKIDKTRVTPRKSKPEPSTDGLKLAALYKRGKKRAAQGNYKGAALDFSEFIDQNRKFGPAYIHRGLANIKLGRFDSALSDFTLAVKHNYQKARAHRLRAAVFWHWKKAADGLWDANKAIELDPGDAEAYLTRGLLYKDLKKTDLAARDYKRALELDPDHQRAKIALRELPNS